MNSEAQAFAEISEFPGYRFGADGTVWSRWLRGSKFHRMCDTWRVMVLNPNTRRGYLYVGLIHSDRRKRDMRVNILILWAFTGSRPKGLEAAHKDGDRTNNRLDNLEWKTHAENIADKFVHGTIRKGQAIPSAILDEDSVRSIRRLFGVVSYAEIGRIYGVSDTAIRSIANGRTWKETAG